MEKPWNAGLTDKALEISPVRFPILAASTAFEGFTVVIYNPDLGRNVFDFCTYEFFPD
jgi:hypothetical protein